MATVNLIPVTKITPEDHGFSVFDNYIKLGKYYDKYLVALRFSNVFTNNLDKIYKSTYKYSSIEYSFQILHPDNTLDVLLYLPGNTDCNSQLSSKSRFSSDLGRDIWIDKEGLNLKKEGNNIGKILGEGCTVKFDGNLVYFLAPEGFTSPIPKVLDLITKEKISAKDKTLFRLWCARKIKEEIVAVRNYKDIHYFIENEDKGPYTEYIRGRKSQDGRRRLSSKLVRLDYICNKLQISKEEVYCLLDNPYNNIVKCHYTEDYEYLKISLNGSNIRTSRKESEMTNKKKESDNSKLYSMFNSTSDVYKYIDENNLWSKITPDSRKIGFKALTEYLNNKLDSNYTVNIVTSFIDSLKGVKPDKYNTSGVRGYRFYSDVWEKE